MSAREKEFEHARPRKCTTSVTLRVRETFLRFQSLQCPQIKELKPRWPAIGEIHSNWRLISTRIFLWMSGLDERGIICEEGMNWQGFHRILGGWIIPFFRPPRFDPVESEINVWLHGGGWLGNISVLKFKIKAEINSVIVFPFWISCSPSVRSIVRNSSIHDRVDTK